MIAGIARLAARNLGRNVRRTLLSVLGIGIGCGIALTLTGFRRSVTEAYSRIAAEAGSGNLRVGPRGFLPSRDERLRLVGGEATLTQVRALPGVKAAAPRARTQALLAMGNHVAGVPLTGVDPNVEPVALRYVRKVTAGRYLRDGDDDAIVLGKRLAEQLHVEVDDDLVVTLVGKDGAMESAMLRVTGLTSSGSRELDLGIAQVTLPTFWRISGLPGLGEIAVVLEDFDALEKMRPQVMAAAKDDEVLRWSELSAELSGHLKQDETMARFMSGIVIFVVLLGVASAQLTAVLERRREFAIFAALGMRPWRLVAQIFTEALWIGLLGALAGAVIAAGPLWYLSTRGLNLGAIVGEMDFENVVMEPIFYARVGWWMVPWLLELAGAATVFSAIYPAIYAARTDPAQALRSV